MHMTKLRKVGGSVMLAVPPAILEQLDLREGATVGVVVEGGRLVIEAGRRKRYRLAALLAVSDFSEPQPREQREWIDAPAIGRELT